MTTQAQLAEELVAISPSPPSPESKSTDNSFSRRSSGCAKFILSTGTPCFKSQHSDRAETSRSIEIASRTEIPAFPPVIKKRSSKDLMRRSIVTARAMPSQLKVCNGSKNGKSSWEGQLERAKITVCGPGSQAFSGEFYDMLDTCQASLEACVVHTAHDNWLGEHSSYTSAIRWLLNRSKVGEQQAAYRAIDVIIKLQWKFRARFKLYTMLGPGVLQRPGWHASYFGDLLFGEYGARAPWMVVPDFAEAKQVVQLVDRFWCIKRPDLIISITGGAQQLTSLGMSQGVLERSLAQVINVTRAWIITGGTDTGVMALAGNALLKFARKQNTPCIGIMPWRALAGHDALAGCRGGTVHYTGHSANQRGAPANKHHTHFIFVDDTKRGSDDEPPWGKEVAVRAAVEDFYSNSLNVPLLLLVLDGGVGTLDTVVQFASQAVKKPIVVVSDSGRAAQAIYDYCTTGNSDNVMPEFKSEKALCMLQKIYFENMKCDGLLVTFVTSSEDLNSVMLDAILKLMLSGNKTVSPKGGGYAEQGHIQHKKRALQMAVQWGHDEKATKIIDSFWQMSDPSSGAQALEVALQTAFENQVNVFIQQIFERSGNSVGRAVRNIDLCRLYRDFQGVDRLGVLSSGNSYGLNTIKMQRRLRSVDGLSHKFEFQATESGSLQAFGPYEKFRQACAEWLGHICPPMFGILYSAADLSEDFEPGMPPFKVTKLYDIFFWSVITGNKDLSWILWQKCDEEPMRLALLAAGICRQLSKVVSWARGTLQGMAQTYEEWAVGMLESAINADEAYAVLSAEQLDWGQSSILDLAMHLKMKTFMHHHYCMELASLWWQTPKVKHQSMFSTDGSRAVPQKERAVQKHVRMLTLSLFGFLSPGMCKGFVESELQDHSLTQHSISELRGLYWHLLQRGDVSFARAIREKLVHKIRVEKSATVFQRWTKWMRGYATDLHELHTTPAIKFWLRFVLHVLLVLMFCIVQTSRAQKMYEEVEDYEEEENVTSSRLRRLKGSDAITVSTSGISGLERVTNLPSEVNSSDKILLAWVFGLAADNLNTMIANGEMAITRVLVPIYLWFMFAFLIAARMLGSNFVEEATGAARSLLLTVEVCLAMYPIFLFSVLLVHYIGLINNKVGVLLVTMERMLIDLVSFSQIFVLVLLAFSVSLAVVGVHTNRNPFEAAMLPAWSVYMDFGLPQVSYADHIVLLVLIWLTTMISAVVMLNLLVAMFADTYTQVQAQSKQIFHYLKYKRIAMYREAVHPVPPPFNLPILLIHWIPSAFRFLLHFPWHGMIRKRNKGSSEAGSNRRVVCIVSEAHMEYSNRVRARRRNSSGSTADGKASASDNSKEFSGRVSYKKKATSSRQANKEVLDPTKSTSPSKQSPRSSPDVNPSAAHETTSDNFSKRRSLFCVAPNFMSVAMPFVSSIQKRWKPLPDAWRATSRGETRARLLSRLMHKQFIMTKLSSTAQRDSETEQAKETQSILEKLDAMQQAIEELQSNFARHSSSMSRSPGQHPHASFSTTASCHWAVRNSNSAPTSPKRTINGTQNAPTLSSVQPVQRLDLEPTVPLRMPIRSHEAAAKGVASNHDEQTLLQAELNHTSDDSGHRIGVDEDDESIGHCGHLRRV